MNNISIAEAQESSEIVLSTILVNSVPAKVLFDSCASYSFVSHLFAAKFELPMSPLPKPVTIICSGIHSNSHIVCHGNQIVIGGHTFIASLIPIGNSDIDVILGMDWFVPHKASIDYPLKAIQLTHPSGQIV